jgi:predicted nucleic acid-binding protein
MFLLDTDALSFSGPTSALSELERARWHDWIRAHHEDIHMSVVTIMEVRFGIERLLRKGATSKANRLKSWIVALEVTHRDRLIKVDSSIAHHAGVLLAKAEAKGFSPSTEDALIAASAALNSFTLITRNHRDMSAMIDECVDPLSLG